MNYTLKQLEEMMEKTGGSLDLRDTSITALPEGLTVGGWLDLSGTSNRQSVLQRLYEVR